MWSKHNECNRFNPNAVSEEMQAIYAASLSRYLHYNDRYHNHEHSLELETKQYERTKQQVEKNERQISTNDFRIIKDAFEVLLKCRQVLMYTYPFAFYLDRNNQAFVFEQNQADLERSCEELSELLEQDLSKETIFKEIKLKIFEKYRYCDKRKNVLLTHVKEGYLNNYWKYLEDI
ncbi:unnamed protein product [Didymodactylos carnosus]|nr:unnamed protein product [Didymodactylos carnosus]CAF4340834.1 unnamed protein product [Didymodactylos carnosus]